MITLKTKSFRNTKINPYEQGKIYYANFIEIEKNIQDYKSHGQLDKFAFSLVTLSNIKKEVEFLLEQIKDQNQKNEIKDLYQEMIKTIDEYSNRISLI